MADYQEGGQGGKEVNVNQRKYDTEVGAANDSRLPVDRNSALRFMELATEAGYTVGDSKRV
jgi:hypothetical protein